MEVQDLLIKPINSHFVVRHEKSERKTDGLDNFFPFFRSLFEDPPIMAYGTRRSNKNRLQV